MPKHPNQASTLTARTLGLVTMLLFVTLLPASAPAGPGRDTSATNINSERIDTLLAGMTLKQKAGQMVMASILGRRMHPGLKLFLDDFQPGGITLFNYNIHDAAQVRALTRSLYRQTGEIKPFIAIDQEGGRVARITEDVVPLPGNMALGATRSVELARQSGELLGKSLSAYGFNMNLAPVLDISSNPHNPVIGTRSYSSDPHVVGRLGTAFIEGLQSSGIIAVGKHFPGHGDTANDSHKRLPVLRYTRAQLLKREAIPFREALQDENGLDAVMTAHIALPRMHHGSLTPATLSKRVLTRLLRQDLGFNGLIITDGLEMKALVDATGSIGSASVAAVQAGADMLSINAQPEIAYEIREALLQAVAQGKLSESRLDVSVRRILRIKAAYGVLGNPHGIAAPSWSQKKHYQQFAYEVASQAATLVKNDNALLPLAGDKYQRVLVVGSHELGQRIRHNLPGLKMELLEPGKRGVTPGRLRHALERTRYRPDAVVIAVRDNKDLPFVQEALKTGQPVAVINLGSPYLITHTRADALLCLFSKQPPAILAAADTISGKIHPTGQLPVPLSHAYPLGYHLAYGDNTPSVRLSQSAR